MIKTTELMLGNLVEFRNKYVKVITLDDEGAKIRYSNGSWCYCLESEINPIPLTDGVKRKLGIIDVSTTTVHDFQNWRTIINRTPIDITPLLSPRYTTHDGVEVWEEDLVYYTIINSYINPQQTIVSKSNMDKIGYIFFSTLEACQSYIDKVTRKPIFTTEDGMNVFEGGKYWFVEKNGMTPEKDKDIPHWTYCTEGSDKLSAKYAYFSTEQLAQAYLNKVWAEKEYNDLINKK